ncbi:MAG TPA: YjbE family putative metal transport protein [Steroidobacteraceae bacterium]|nr:YjbE family putative metal transport protein [Steroidobacteraceae bacterium]
MHDGGLIAQFSLLAQVLLIDLALAGDNAVVVGMVVTGLPVRQRRRAIAAGLFGAAVLRLGLSFVTLRLLAIVGLVLAGGLLLLWVAWKMHRELRRRAPPDADGAAPKSLGRAMAQIVAADLSMSFDNVLAVAGAARGHAWVLVAGLGLSVLLMGIAANGIASILAKRRWLAWGGLVTVLYVALRMIWRGSLQVLIHAH